MNRMATTCALIALGLATAAVADDVDIREEANAPTPANARGVVYGPFVTYPAPGTAEFRWQTAEPSTAAVSYWTKGGEEMRVERTALSTDHRVIVKGLPRNTPHLYKVETAIGGTVSTSEPYDFDTTFNYATVDAPSKVDGIQSASLEAKNWERYLDARGDKGIAVVLNGNGSLALALAQATKMTVTVFNTNADVVTAARQAFAKAGIYGQRVTVRHVASLADTQLTPHHANAVIIVGEEVDAAVQAEAERILHPYGILAISDTTGEFSSTTFGTPLPGAGQWTHQYGDAANSSNSRDTLGGAGGTGDMMVQWLGRPGGNFGIDRNPRMPAPLSVNGRLFHQGMNKLVAVDMYNGSILWLHEIPGLRRVNLPRDASNWCADDDSLYAAIHDRLWVFDAVTGEVRDTYTLPVAEGENEWGYVARVDDLLYGSATMKGSSYLHFFGKDEWYDKTEGAGTYKVCSENLFAMDPATGEIKWQYKSKPIINTTITIADGRIMFVEARHPALDSRRTSRIDLAELWLDQVLVTLDAQTGKPVFEKPIDVEDGIVVYFAVYKDGWYMLESSHGGNYHLAGFDTQSWEREWHATHPWQGGDHSGHMMHPAIVGDIVYLEPRGYNIATGEMVTDKVGRREGCATYAATENALIYRGAERRVAMWDLETAEVSTWKNLRPSCWLSVIPSGGMILAPEGGAGCSCGGWIETSLGFIPKPN